jgi:hypothetical protein
VVPTQGAEDGNCSIVVEQIDGLRSGFAASHEGPNWHESGNAKPLLLAAAKHRLSLKISYEQAAGGHAGSPSPQGSGDQGSVGGVGEYKATTLAEIFASVEAGHVYRITADYESEAISIVLWDETRGAPGRARVADWSFSCPRTHTGGTGPGDHFL